MARSKPKLDQGARVGNYLRLPPVILLELLQGALRALVKAAVRSAVKVVLAYQRFLYFSRTIRVDRLLAAWLPAPRGGFLATLPARRFGALAARFARVNRLGLRTGRMRARL